MRFLRRILLLCLVVSGQAEAAEIDVRVGIVAYEDFHSELDHYQQFFGQLSERDPSVHFQIALGSYGDVLHWIDRQLVDVALVTPGAFVSLLPRVEDPPAAVAVPARCEYLATIQLPPAVSEFASEARKTAGFHSTYRSVCLVAKSSRLKTVEDLRRAAQANELEFLFVHPMSISGRVVPLQGLRRAGIIPSDQQVRFTYSHTQSMRLLADQDATVERVAFVWDDAAAPEPALQTNVRNLHFPELQQLEIPHDVVVARSGYEYSDRLQSLIDGAQSDRYRFIYQDDWESRFADLRDWLTSAQLTSPVDAPQRLSLDEISQSLLQYSRSQPQPPRLALVLSGGGAKCSYQVGAVAALEARLADLRRDSGAPGLDIALVVGTSGGAINSVPIAMGISRTEEGRQAFRETWCALDQRDIVRPSLLVRANMGLWFAILQTAVVIWLVRWLVPDIKHRGRMFAVIYTLLAAAEVLIGYLPFTPWPLLGTNHVFHHIWLWWSFGVRASAWILLAIGVAALVMEAVRARRGRHITIPTWLTTTTLLAGILGLPLLQTVTIFLFQETLSTGAGMQQTLAREFPHLINRHLEQQALPVLDLDAADHLGDRMRNVSRQVIDRGLLSRDLVITGSCLRQTSEDLPSDLYFYAAADRTSDPPPFGERGVSLTDRPHTLLDVVMGSGSIFPIFPPRTVAGVPRPDEQIELVDGGFAHNSPVEAAVLWGATHILLIEATPRRRSQSGNFLRNATSAFKHLHRQAQLLDTRSRGRVTIYSLAPEPPHICVLDFADNLIADSIERGHRDAATNRSSFHRELGEPVFSIVRTAD